MREDDWEEYDEGMERNVRKKGQKKETKTYLAGTLLSAHPIHKYSGD
jgi:hypothetical protein